jgi:hypothetical protein
VVLNLQQAQHTAHSPAHSSWLRCAAGPAAAADCVAAALLLLPPPQQRPHRRAVLGERQMSLAPRATRWFWAISGRQRSSSSSTTTTTAPQRQRHCATTWRSGIGTCRCGWAALRVPPVPAFRHDRRGLATSAGLDVTPDGCLTARTVSFDLDIRTENQRCDSIRFEVVGEEGDRGDNEQEETAEGGSKQGESPRELLLRARSEFDVQLRASAAPASSKTATTSPSTAVSSGGDHDGGGGGGGGAADILRGLIPEKYSVDITTGGGNLQMGRLEGATHVVTEGGSITLDKVTSAEIELDSGGGAVAARVLQGQVAIQSGGGQIWLQRLVSPMAVLDASVGGDIECGALYADSYTITTDGGNVSVGSAHAEESSTVATGGGAVYLGSVEGSGPLRIDSAGGSVGLHLSRQTADLTVCSGGGDVQVKVSKGRAFRLQLRGHSVHVDPGHQLEAAQDDDSDGGGDGGSDGGEGDGGESVRGVLNRRQSFEEWYAALSTARASAVPPACGPTGGASERRAYCVSVCGWMLVGGGC